MRKTGTHAGLATMLVIALATTGCGGSGGGGAGSAPSASAPPTAAPAPTPSPTPTPSGPLFGALEQTSTQQFATLGFSYIATEVAGWDIAVEPASVESARAIGVSFVAPSQLRLAIAGFGDGPLLPNGGGGVSDGRTTPLGYNVIGGSASLFLIRRPDGAYLASSAFGIWHGPPVTGQGATGPVSTFVYGVSTAPGDVPGEGTAIYYTEFSGIAAIASAGDLQAAYHNGTARLTVDFRARTVTGNIDVAAEDALATYSLTQVVFAPDGTGFTARLMRGNMLVDGFLEARFTGPSAREMIVRWSTPLQVKGKPGLLFSVWGAGRS